MLCGSSNSRPDIAKALESLNGDTLSSVEVDGSIPELLIRFTSGRCLRSMIMADMDPQWSIRLPCEEWIYARSGSLRIGDGTREASAQEETAFRHAEETATRWGVPQAGVMAGACSACRWLVSLDGDGCLLDYGACTCSESPFDGRTVSLVSACEAFLASNAE